MPVRYFAALLAVAALTLGIPAVPAVYGVEAGDGREDVSTVLIDYRRTGGVAGFHDHLRIDRQGNAVLTGRGTETAFALEPDEFATLIALLVAADFPALEPEYRAPGVISDGISYTIRYRCHTVRTETTVVPAPLEPALQALDAIISSAPR